ncbi:hypothetical protein BD779DRAFT_1668525 [Infundibulicybe gibba]|nr:hypothetical protein BD779DRAFT_1668525 [Infundibulicybe gibba]
MSWDGSMHFSSATLVAILSAATFFSSASAASACSGSTIALAAVPDEGDRTGRYVAYTASACRWNMAWGFGKGDRCSLTDHVGCQGSAISKIKIRGKCQSQVGIVRETSSPVMLQGVVASVLTGIYNPE